MSDLHTMKSLSSLKTKGNLAIAALVVTGLYWLMEGILILAVKSDPFFLSDDQIETVLSIEDAYPVVAFATAVLFVVWSFAAHTNLTSLGRTDIRHSDQATIWWWIVPIANLFKPFQVMYETVRGSTAEFDSHAWKTHSLEPVAIWWTGLFIGGIVINSVGENLLSEAFTEAAFSAAANTYAVGSVLLTAAAAAAVIMIAKVTGSQIELASRIPEKNSSEQPTRRALQSASLEQPSGETEESDRPQQAYCTTCGTGFAANDQFCGTCGSQRPSNDVATAWTAGVPRYL